MNQKKSRKPTKKTWETTIIVPCFENFFVVLSFGFYLCCFFVCFCLVNFLHRPNRCFLFIHFSITIFIFYVFFFDFVLLPWGRGLPPRQSKRCLLASRVEASRGPWPEWQAGRQRGRQADRETDSQPARQTATETDMTAHNLQPQCFSHRSSNRMYAPRCFVLRTC